MTLSVLLAASLLATVAGVQTPATVASAQTLPPPVVPEAGPDLAACGDVSPTPYFTLVYGELAVGEDPAPLGAVVEVLTPRGEVAGCTTVRYQGHYGYVHVYGEDQTIPGFREGEALTFQVNGVAATATPELTWTKDWISHQVDLAVESIWFSIHLPLVVRNR